MGEVYRAHDTQLDRTVAVKVIRPEVAADPDRMRRFEKEARAVAALTHPSVAQVYEIGRADGLRFIVMEYVEGKTLHEFLRARLLTCREIVNLMVPVTEVLAEAHSKGIVHRDIKPGNIMVTERGTPKVLDFGLAKFDRGDPAAPTLTDPGQVMGTAEYMSPEQALGREVDSRTDIFSLGAVLYEMATGRPAFRGPTVAAVYDAILHRAPPPPREVNPEVPEALEHIIWKALEKDREMRYQTASDLRVDLKRIFHESATHPAAPVAPARRLRRWAWAAVTGAVLLAVLGAGLWFRGMRVAPRAPGANWRVLPLTSYPGNESHATFSPDGNQIAFTWNGAGVEKWDIYVKLVGAGTPLRLTTDPANDVSPAWSPDGRHIAFLREMDQSAALMIVPALGGLERKLADLWPHRVGHEAPFLAWSPDSGTLAVADRMSPNEPLSLYLVKVSSGERRRITTPPVNWLGDSCPAFSPDGKSLAFVRTSSVSVQDLYVLPLGGGQPKRLTEDNRRIFGMAWNPARNRILFSSNRGANSRLWEVAPNGGPPERLPGIGESAGFLAVTKDGARLAYSRSSIDTNIWRYFLPQGNTRKPPVRLISSTRHDLSPQYSPDGRRIVFSSNRSGSMEIWLCDSEGLNASQLTNFGGPPTGSPRWSPDGRWIAFDSRPGGNPDIYVVAAEGGTPRRLTTDPAEDVMPNWSQDGRYLYFASRRSGDYQVWKMPAEGGNAVPVTRLGGFFAQEAADGRYIYYVKGLNSPGLWRAPATGGEETPVLESLRAGYSAYWALSRQGVYYLERDDPADGPRRFYLHFLDLAARKDQRVMELDNRPFNAGLSLAPQGGSFLYSQVDSSDTDLLLVDDFQQR
jgi:Tol biopolymer transport system component/predicted Ser/Thr protein kinase